MAALLRSICCCCETVVVSENKEEIAQLTELVTEVVSEPAPAPVPAPSIIQAPKRDSSISISMVKALTSLNVEPEDPKPEWPQVGKGRRITLRLVKGSDDSKFGFINQPPLLPSPKKLLEVKEVIREQLLDQWNAKQVPYVRILPGSLIISVNGVEDDPRKMRQEMYRNDLIICFFVPVPK